MTKSRQRRSPAATFVALSTLILSAIGSLPSQAAELTPASLRLKWLPQAQFVGYYVAKAKGWYADEGIDLTINEGRGSANTVQVVAAGSDTFGLADSSSVILTAARAPRRRGSR